MRRSALGPLAALAYDRAGRATMTLTADTTVHPKDAAPLATRPWTKHYDPGVPATLEYPRIPLTSLMRATVERRAGNGHDLAARFPRQAP